MAVAANVTVVSPGAGGDVRLFPAGAPVPNASTVNFHSGQTRTNNALLGLGAGGRIASQCDLPPRSPAAVQLVVDVSGYFE